VVRGMAMEEKHCSWFGIWRERDLNEKRVFEFRGLPYLLLL